MASELPYTSGHMFEIHKAIVRGASLFTLPDHLVLPDDAARLVLRSAQGSAPDFTACAIQKDLIEKIQHADDAELRWRSEEAIRHAWHAREKYSNTQGTHFIRSYAVLGKILNEPKKGHYNKAPIQGPREIRATLSDIVGKILRDLPLDVPAHLDEFRRNTLLQLTQLQMMPEEIQRATDPETFTAFQTSLASKEGPVSRVIKATHSYVCLLAACIYSPKLCSMFEETIPKVATRIHNLFEHHGQEFAPDDHWKLAQNWTVLSGVAHHAGLSHRIDRALGWSIVEDAIEERIPPQNRARPKPCQL